MPKVYSFVHIIGGSIPLLPGDTFANMITDDELKVEYRLKRLQKKHKFELSEYDRTAFYNQRPVEVCIAENLYIILRLEIADYIDLIED